MKNLQADVYALLDHLKRCPIEFLQPSIYQPKGVVNTDALVLDVWRKISGNPLIPNTNLPSLDDLKFLNQNQLIAIHLGCWFFWQELFFNVPERVLQTHNFLMKELPMLSTHFNFQKFIDDDERAEEFVRLALRCCSVVPSGETQQEADDKWDAINTLKRLAILKKTNDQLQRMKAIKRKMEEDQTREAATVYGRE